MVAELLIVQLGLGGVGQALLRQYLDLAERYPWLGYAALSDRSGLVWLEGGWTQADLRAALATKEKGQPLSALMGQLDKHARFFVATPSGLPDLQPLLSTKPPDSSYVVADVTAQRTAYDIVLQARQHNAHVILCNKWALAEDHE